MVRYVFFANEFLPFPFACNFLASVSLFFTSSPCVNESLVSSLIKQSSFSMVCEDHCRLSPALRKLRCHWFWNLLNSFDTASLLLRYGKAFHSIANNSSSSVFLGSFQTHYSQITTMHEDIFLPSLRYR